MGQQHSTKTKLDLFIKLRGTLQGKDIEENSSYNTTSNNGTVFIVQ